MELLRSYIKHPRYEHYIPYKRKVKEIHNVHNLHAVYDYHDQKTMYILVHIVMIDSQCHIHSE